MTPPKKFTMKLADTVKHNPKFTQFRFELIEPNTIEFQAGQYGSFAVDEQGNRRSYSICSSPDNTHGLEVLLDVTPNGIGVQYLTKLAYGDQVQMLGPLGMFFVTPESEGQPLVFIATGSGIAPFRGMILDQLHNKKNTAEITLYWGLRHVEEMCWQDEFQELAEQYKNFHFHPVISQPVPDWPLCRGHVNDCLLVHQQPADAHYYLCGNEHMITDMIQQLKNASVAPEKIHHEKFY